MEKKKREKGAESTNEAMLPIIWWVHWDKIVFFRGYAVTNENTELETLLCLQCSFSFVTLCNNWRTSESLPMCVTADGEDVFCEMHNLMKLVLWICT
jgi:hypothetical protein